jgi:hypothetical protein
LTDVPGWWSPPVCGVVDGVGVVVDGPHLSATQQRDPDGHCVVGQRPPTDVPSAAVHASPVMHTPDPRLKRHSPT